MNCIVEDCSRKSGSLKMCDKHYQRFRKHGTTDVIQHQEQHGLRDTLEYRIWSGIKTRCFNQNHKSYKNYGGRGITMCDRWHNSFLAFYEDMGVIPSQKHSIERNNVNGDYEPSNCRWATKHEQVVNVQSRKPGICPGLYYHKEQKKWVARLIVNKKYVLSERFTNYEDAVKARKDAELLYLGYNINHKDNL